MPPVPIDFAPPADDRETAVYADIMAQALMFPPPEEFDWPARFGRDNIRLARRNGRVAGGLAYVRMGQFFGGRSVPMVGISSVGVAPDQRSSGVATAMMRRAVEELAAEGVPLSALYPATQPVYRRQGYELAGVRLGYRMPIRSIDARERELELQAIDASEQEAVRSVYVRVAPHRPGNLDRCEWNWKRIWHPRQGKSRGFLISGRDGPQGYAIFLQERPQTGFRYHHNADLSVREATLRADQQPVGGADLSINGLPRVHRARCLSPLKLKAVRQRMVNRSWPGPTSTGCSRGSSSSRVARGRSPAVDSETTRPLSGGARLHPLPVPGSHMDHIVPRSRGGSDDWANLQTLCASCHSRRDVVVAAGETNPEGTNGSRVSSCQQAAPMVSRR